MISRTGFLLLNARHKRDVKGKILKESKEKEDISFSPLAMPLLAGPGTISMLINMSVLYPELQKTGIIMSVVLCVTICIYVVFSMATKIFNFTGQAGLKTLSKIMGLIVLSIGIEMISSGVFNMVKSTL